MNKKCQIFTPDNIVTEMLNLANYKVNLYGKKVLENSCGDGKILSRIVYRYIKNCLDEKYELNIIKKGLENDIYANEIDEIHMRNCIKNLDSIAKKFNIYGVKWNVSTNDYLYDVNEKKFDYIIGNPPYITYRDLDLKTRKKLRDKFASCKKGKFDYYYAFIEKSIEELSEKGKLVYIIPSSIFKNEFAFDIRNIMKNNITKIVDFRGLRVFSNVLTPSSIILIDRRQSKKVIIYEDRKNNEFKKIEKRKLLGKWNFDYSLENKEIFFGDLFECSISVATLLNDVFLLKGCEQNELTNFKREDLENNILRKAISPRNMTLRREERIIFPYYYKNKKLCRYSEKEFKEKYPKAYDYLSIYRIRLIKRCIDKNSNWFEYGRSQALAHLNQKKLLISTIITNKVNVYKLDKNDIPYSGIYIISKGKDKLTTAIKILESKEFFNYICNVGISASGTSIRITPKDIKNFSFTKEELELWKI